ncbi:MAG: ribonuclease HI, partial [Vibrio toranzoniae]
ISSKEQNLSRYSETDDLTEILALRAG